MALIFFFQLQFPCSPIHPTNCLVTYNPYEDNMEMLVKDKKAWERQ